MSSISLLIHISGNDYFVPQICSGITQVQSPPTVTSSTFVRYVRLWYLNDPSNISLKPDDSLSFIELFFPYRYLENCGYHNCNVRNKLTYKVIP